MAIYTGLLYFNIENTVTPQIILFIYNYGQGHNETCKMVDKMSTLLVIGLELAIDPPGGVLYTVIF